MCNVFDPECYLKKSLEEDVEKTDTERNSLKIIEGPSSGQTIRYSLSKDQPKKRTVSLHFKNYKKGDILNIAHVYSLNSGLSEKARIIKENQEIVGEGFVPLTIPYYDLVKGLRKEESIEEGSIYEVRHYIEYDEKSNIEIPVPIIFSTKIYYENYEEFKKQGEKYITPPVVNSNLDVTVSGLGQIRPTIIGNDDDKETDVELTIRTKDDYGELLNAEIDISALETKYFNIEIIETKKEENNEKTIILVFKEKYDILKGGEGEIEADIVKIPITSRVKRRLPSHNILFSDPNQYRESKIRSPSSDEITSPQDPSEKYAEKQVDESSYESREGATESDIMNFKRSEAFLYLKEHGEKVSQRNTLTGYKLNGKSYPLNEEDLDENQILTLLDIKNSQLDSTQTQRTNDGRGTGRS